jgi:hypothetical protein
MEFGFQSAERRRLWIALMDAKENLPTADTACESDPDVFFYDETVLGYTSSEANSKAKSLCLRCPLKALCAEYAIVDDVRYGVWGGTTPSERAALRRHRGLR